MEMPSDLPSKKDLIEWVKAHPERVSKNDIARAFAVARHARPALKALLSELAEEGLIPRKARRAGSDTLPAVGVLEICDIDADGNMFACPSGRESERVFIHVPPHIRAPEIGARILAKIKKTPEGEEAYEGRIMRVFPKSLPIRGVFYPIAGGGEIRPVLRSKSRGWVVSAASIGKAKKGDIVRAELTGKVKHGRKEARITAIEGTIGEVLTPVGLSQIAVKMHNLSDGFSADEMDEAAAVEIPNREGYEDLSHLSFITIDPADARDHDDAVYAERAPEKGDGYILWVAIADVAAFVREGGALDRGARARANSVYFPDRVLPMLPESLSNGVCSLHEKVMRPVLAVRLHVGADGSLKSHRFSRAFIRVAAALSYEQVQCVEDGENNAHIDEEVKGVIGVLFETYRTVVGNRRTRTPLDLDLPERKISLDEAGGVSSISLSVRLDAHRLIEEFMIMANVAAAETLIAHKMALIYRTHPAPEEESLKALSHVARAFGVKFAHRGKAEPHLFNQLLEQAEANDKKSALSLCILRTQAQAIYSTRNEGHFGLDLRHYTHFTSPIRRYSDLLIHRGLIAAHGWRGDGGERALEREELEATAVHLSQTERRAMQAERETNERLTAFYLREHIGRRFDAHISGLARFGLFVKLAENGAEGLVPMSSLGRMRFRFDEKTQTLYGRGGAVALVLGMALGVRLQRVEPLTGGLVFGIETVQGKAF